MTERTTTRRRLVGTVASMATVGAAGCLGGDDSDDPTPSTTPAGTVAETPSTTPAETRQSATPRDGTDRTDAERTTGAATARSVDAYLADTSNYDGTTTDYTAYDDVDITVGAAGNGGQFAFDPPAVEVTTGTTVTWGWTGEGSVHNVVHEGDQFESRTTGGTGHEFAYTFDSAGTYRYYCEVHQSAGMRGVVVVTDG